MKKINGLLIAIASILIVISCQNKNASKYEKIASMNWLLGAWENKMEEGNLSENWIMKNDSTFVGESYFIKGKDTISAESMELSQKREDLFYIPTVKGQNNDEPVTFKLTTATINEFTFENPTHDYPQKIVYKMVNATNLVATISGIQQGKPSSESYPMKKK